MNTKQIKAVTMHDFKSLKWLLAGFLVIYALILLIAYYSSSRWISSWISVSDFRIYFHLLWGIIIASGILTRDRRIGIKPWLDAMPVKHSSILAVRFITRLITVIVGPVIFFLITLLLKEYMYLSTYHTFYTSNPEYPIMIAVSAYSLAAVFAVRAKSQSSAMGTGLLAFIILSALIQLPRVINPIFCLSYMPYSVTYFLTVILLLCCFFIILNSGSIPDVQDRIYWRKAAIIFFAGFICVLIAGGVAYSMIKNLPAEKMHLTRYMSAVAGDKEACIIRGTPKFFRMPYKRDLVYLYMASSQGIRNIGIFRNYVTNVSPNGNFFAHTDGIYDIKGKRIIPGFPQWGSVYHTSAKWSPDSRHFALNINDFYSNDEMIRFVSLEDPEKNLVWKPAENLKDIHIITWIDNSSIVIAAGAEDSYKLITVDISLESRAVYEGRLAKGKVYNEMRFRIFFNSEDKSIFVLEETDNPDEYHIKEVFLLQDKVLSHGMGKRCNGYLFHSDFMAVFITDNQPEGDIVIKTVNLRDGQESYYYPSNLTNDVAIFFRNEDFIYWVKISPNGRYMAFRDDSMILQLLDLEKGDISIINRDVVFDFLWTSSNNMFVHSFPRDHVRYIMEESISYYDTENAKWTEISHYKQKIKEEEK